MGGGGVFSLVFMDQTKHCLKETKLMTRTIFEHTRYKRYSNMCQKMYFKNFSMRKRNLQYIYGMTTILEI